MKININYLNRINYLTANQKNRLHDLLLVYEGLTINTQDELINEYFKDIYNLNNEDIKYILEYHNIKTIER